MVFSTAVTGSVISIHAPRMGSDSCAPSGTGSRQYFNPRSPDGERPMPPCGIWSSFNFNPRSPDGERRMSPIPTRCGSVFQSTLPGWGATRSGDGDSSGRTFQSTLPGWGATCSSASCPGRVPYFNPRSPDGERLSKSEVPPNVSRISIHAPRMGSDIRRTANQLGQRISIHAPRMGSDREAGAHALQFVGISIHAPRMGSDSGGVWRMPGSPYFNPRSPDEERRTRPTPGAAMAAYFNPRSPDGERRPHARPCP